RHSRTKWRPVGRRCQESDQSAHPILGERRGPERETGCPSERQSVAVWSASGGAAPWRVMRPAVFLGPKPYSSIHALRKWLQIGVYVTWPQHTQLRIDEKVSKVLVLIYKPSGAHTLA